MNEEEKKQNLEENESTILNVEELTEIRGGVEDEDKDSLEGSCGLGCFLRVGSGGFDNPVD